MIVSVSVGPFRKRIDHLQDRIEKQLKNRVARGAGSLEGRQSRVRGANQRVEDVEDIGVKPTSLMPPSERRS